MRDGVAGRCQERDVSIRARPIGRAMRLGMQIAEELVRVSIRARPIGRAMRPDPYNYHHTY